MGNNVITTLFGIITLSICLLACSGEYPPEPKKIVDLSPTRGGDYALKVIGPKFVKDFEYRNPTTFEHRIIEEPIYLADSYITLYNHIGVHHDPPNHIIKGALSTDQVPLEKFYGRARIIDFRDKLKDEPLVVSDFESEGLKAGDDRKRIGWRWSR